MYQRMSVSEYVLRTYVYICTRAPHTYLRVGVGGSDGGGRENVNPICDYNFLDPNE